MFIKIRNNSRLNIIGHAHRHIEQYNNIKSDNFIVQDMISNISPTSGPNGLKFRYVVALEQSFPMSIKSKRSGGNLQYLPSYPNINYIFINFILYHNDKFVYYLNLKNAFKSDNSFIKNNNFVDTYLILYSSCLKVNSFSKFTTLLH
ncbi:hypothetical protein BCR32DRAFT_286373 [Anaeromyces robustus]|uniref:Uncharacterized protein n=1 Tax=Anaeromyces robustus TaxID=1754192 RepID=A0A1Y1VXU0_9FUNG|nr:hypothetical protein BCR32DRAFT_286373 [Anaeromyces robustus]|eukprot:ORX66098.1 hypothetical protein BCR32DRAFT_286373 [Anaeromyces robustus]